MTFIQQLSAAFFWGNITLKISTHSRSCFHLKNSHQCLRGSPFLPLPPFCHLLYSVQVLFWDIKLFLLLLNSSYYLVDFNPSKVMLTHLSDLFSFWSYSLSPDFVNVDPLFSLCLFYSVYHVRTYIHPK